MNSKALFGSYKPASTKLCGARNKLYLIDQAVKVDKLSIVEDYACDGLGKFFGVISGQLPILDGLRAIGYFVKKLFSYRKTDVTAHLLEIAGLLENVVCFLVYLAARWAMSVVLATQRSSQIIFQFLGFAGSWIKTRFKAISKAAGDSSALFVMNCRQSSTSALFRRFTSLPNHGCWARLSKAARRSDIRALYRSAQEIASRSIAVKMAPDGDENG